MTTKSREYRLNLLGADNTAVLESTSMLAFAYQEQGRLEQAVQLQVQVIETRKMKLGEDDPDTLMTMFNLACI